MLLLVLPHLSGCPQLFTQTLVSITLLQDVTLLSQRYRVVIDQL